MLYVAFRWLAVGLTLGLFAASGAHAGVNRVALVIGNSAYMHTSPLANPRNDAADIAQALRKLGFKVTEGLDLDKTALESTIRQFVEGLPGAKAAIFFYAGHGLQVDGQNYLIPVDAKLATRGSLGFETIRMDMIQRAMESEATTNIIFLDACRNNPLGRNLAKTLGTRSANVGEGLAQVESGEGTLISFSTQPGNVALDGAGRNSPYAQALLTHISKPGADLSTILINIRNDVMTSTERRQVPWEHSALTAAFYFSEPPQQSDTASRSAVALPPSVDVEIAYWNSVKDSTSAALIQTYLDKYPNGNFRPIAVARMEQLKAQDSATATQEAKLKADAKAKEDAKLKADTRAREGAQSKADARAREEAKSKEDTRAKAEAKAREDARLEAEARAKRTAMETERQEQERRRAEKAAEQANEKQRLAALQVDQDYQRQVLAEERRKLTRSLQGELKRVGCNPVDVNGNWDSRSQAALQKFAVRTRTALSAAEPSPGALKAVSAAKPGACGVDCPSGQTADADGRCVTQSRSVRGGGGAGNSSWESNWRSTGR